MSALNPNLYAPGSALAIMLGQGQSPQNQSMLGPPMAFNTQPPPDPSSFLPPQGAPMAFNAQPPAGSALAPPPPVLAPAIRQALASRPAPSGGGGLTGPQQAQTNVDQTRSMLLNELGGISQAMQSQYGNYQQGASTYKDFLNNIADQIGSTQTGPSQAERMGRIGAAFGTPTRTGTLGETMGNVGAASAQELQAQREADLQKQLLVAKYAGEAGELGMQIPMMGMQQNASRLNNTQTRLTSLDMANARNNNPNSLVIRTGDGDLAANPVALQARAQAAAYSAVATAKAKQDLYSGQFTPEALDLLSEQAYRTGKVNIPYGVTRNDPTIVSKVWDMAAAKAAADNNPAAQTVANQHAYQSSSTALTQLTKQATMVGAYEKTAEKNMDLALSEGVKVDRSGSPLLNRGIIAWKQGVTGDPQTAGFVNALTAAENEYAKVLSGATGASGITDSARKEAHDLFSKIDSQQMLQYTLGPNGIAKQEMHNRMASFNDQQRALNDIMTKHGAGSAPIAGKTPEAPAATAVGQGQTVTKGNVQDYADKHGLSYEDALAHVQAAGFKVGE